jgi:hypothetical protein
VTEVSETEQAIGLMNELIKIMKERETEYGSNEHKTAQILMILFPEGIHVNSFEAAVRMKFLIYIIDKLSRYSKKGNKDSLMDLAGYALRLAVFDPKE